LARCASKKSAVEDARPARSTARRWELGSETDTSSEEKASHRTAEALAVFFTATGRATVMRAEVEVRAIMKSVRWIDDDLCDAVRSGGMLITSRTLSYPGDVSCSRLLARRRAAQVGATEPNSRVVFRSTRLPAQPQGRAPLFRVQRQGGPYQVGEKPVKPRPWRPGNECGPGGNLAS